MMKKKVLKRLVAALVVCTVLVSGACVVFANAEDIDYITMYADGTVDVYEEADPESRIVGQMDDADSVRVYELDSAWYETESGTFVQAGDLRCEQYTEEPWEEPEAAETPAVVEAPAVQEEPAAEEPAAEETTAEAPVTEEEEEPAVEETAEEAPAAEEEEEPEAEETTEEVTVMEEAAEEEPVAEEAAEEAPTTEETAEEPVTVEESIVEEPAAEAPAAEEPIEETPAAEEVIEEEPAVGEEVTEEPAAEEETEAVPEAKDVTIDESAAEEEVTEEPAAEEEPETMPAAEDVIIEEPAAEEEVTEEPAAETAAEEPAAEAAAEEPEIGAAETAEDETLEEIEEYETPLGLRKYEMVVLTSPEQIVSFREDANETAAVIAELGKDTQIIVIGVEGGWANAVVEGEKGYIYLEDIRSYLFPETATAQIAEMETEAPAEAAQIAEIETEDPEEDMEDPTANMKVTIFSSQQGTIHIGETVDLCSEIEGFDGYEVRYQWVCDKHDGNSFQNVEGANESTFSFIASAETMSWDWQLLVYLD